MNKLIKSKVINKSVKKEYDKVVLVCSCGVYVAGNSKDNAEYNMKVHLNSPLHQRQISGANLIEAKVDGKKKRRG